MATENGRQLNVESFLIHLALESQYYFPFITVSYKTYSIKFHKNSWSHKKGENRLHIHVMKYNIITNIILFSEKHT